MKCKLMGKLLASIYRCHWTSILIFYTSITPAHQKNKKIYKPYKEKHLKIWNLSPQFPCNLAVIETSLTARLQEVYIRTLDRNQQKTGGRNINRQQQLAKSGRRVIEPSQTFALLFLYCAQAQIVPRLLTSLRCQIK